MTSVVANSNWLGAIVDRVEAGESVRNCCDTPGGPTRNQFRWAVAANPELGARYRAALAKWSAPHARSRHHFAAIVRRIEAGEILAEIFDSDDPSFPDTCSFKKFLRSSPHHAERYRKAFRLREASPGARGAQPKFTDDELRQAAAALAATSTRYVSVTRVAPGAPHARTLMEARSRNADLCAIIEGAVVSRITRLKIKAGPLFKPLTPGLILPRRRAPRVLYANHQLITALRRNQVFNLADAAVSKRLDRFDRDDIIAETVLEVIEDDLDLSDVASVAAEVTAEHLRKKYDRNAVSIDKPFGPDSTLSLADTLSNW